MTLNSFKYLISTTDAIILIILYILFKNCLGKSVWFWSLLETSHIEGGYFAPTDFNWVFGLGRVPN